MVHYVDTLIMKKRGPEGGGGRGGIRGEGNPIIMDVDGHKDSKSKLFIMCP